MQFQVTAAPSLAKQIGAEINGSERHLKFDCGCIDMISPTQRLRQPCHNHAPGYHITLSQSERKALDWIGDRYWNGYDLYRFLWTRSRAFPNNVNWDSSEDILFVIPEHVAWEIQELAEEEGFPCFAPGLQTKFQSMLDSIV